MFDNKIFLRGIVVSKNFKVLAKENKSTDTLFLKILSSCGNKSNFSFDCSLFGNYAKSLEPLIVPWDQQTKQGSQVLVEASFYSISTSEYQGKTYPKISLTVHQVEILNKSSGAKSTPEDDDISF
jgi:hypothetical protein